MTGDSDGMPHRPPAVQIVGPTDGWVLERLARRLAGKLPYAAFVPGRPAPRPAGLAYYVNYALYDRPSGLVDVGFFTHRDDAHGFLDRARRLDHCVCMAGQYADWLRAQGVTAVTHLPMGFDAHRYAPRLVLGVVGRLEHPRKGKPLVDRVRRLPFVDVLVTGGEVPEGSLRDWYQRLDYVLVPATAEGGPLALLEGLAMGKPVIAPAGVGLVPELSPTGWIHTYPAGDAAALERLVVERYEVKRQGAALVRGRTWDDWAAGHDRLFRRLLAARGCPLPPPAPGFRFGLTAEVPVPPGRLTAAAEGALDELARCLFHGRYAAARETLERLIATLPEAAALRDTIPPDATG
jgi:glycosyltransferase involved in cell wall biosynthesis